MLRILSLILLASLGIPASAAGTPAKPAKPKVPAEHERLIFFVATGKPGACGAGCSEWIAAEGRFDRDAAARFTSFLSGLGKRKLPIFFHSPGGSMGAGLAIGRMLRSHGMTAGVGRTLPDACDSKIERKASCDALKRSGVELPAQLRTYRAQCNSSCGFALLGATERQVASDAVIGVHTPRLGEMSVDGFLTPLPGGRTETAAQANLWKTHFERYVDAMGIAPAYVDAVYSVPNEKLKVLTRSEIVRFGIDTRKFVESAWQSSDKPRPMVAKVMTQVEADADRTLRISLLCAASGALTLVAIREGADRPAATDEVVLAAGATRVKLTAIPGYKPRAGTPPHDARMGRVGPKFVDQVAREGSFTLTERAAASRAGPRVTAVPTARLASLRGTLKSCVPRAKVASR